jgi:hypothetical protein
MKNAEFEEKDFEAALYQQLAQGSTHLWTPGQVFEHHFGIDAALKTANQFFLGAVGGSLLQRQLCLSHLKWGYVWRSYGKKRGLPSFDTNALLQAKRPQHLQGKSSKLSTHGICGQYWRFHLDDNQQRLLERLSKKVGRRAVVCYACPAMNKWDELDKSIGDGSLAERCTYVVATQLAGHRTWCFDRPGAVGVACSEPVFVRGVPFLEMIASIAPQTSVREPDPERAANELMALAANIDEVVRQEAEEHNPLAQAILRRLGQLAQPSQASGPSAAFIHIALTVEYAGCHWYAVGVSQHDDEA